MYVCVHVVIICNEGDIQLVEGGVAYEGRIEYCSGNAWGTICDDGWTDLDAAVACFQMGYPREGQSKNCELPLWVL